eukprot:NODE_6242_length_591_cov_18.226937_g5832_i0.p1 GENE.NODE_6242_length_591_cov_18.226937_g5832_i0~~NODE_6242_length_591_cov_18.226937_g5832_i0.p1  ORF type:complete len:160 (+),score=9.65 NODE_6242_length_591_cov_18.226937_g5832_i0:72-551(+)
MSCWKCGADAEVTTQRVEVKRKGKRRGQGAYELGDVTASEASPAHVSTNSCAHRTPEPHPTFSQTPASPLPVETSRPAPRNAFLEETPLGNLPSAKPRGVYMQPTTDPLTRYQPQNQQQADVAAAILPFVTTRDRGRNPEGSSFVQENHERLDLPGMVD